MSRQLRAITLLFRGSEPNSETIAALSDIIGMSCQTTGIEFFTYDSKDLADSLIQSHKATYVDSGKHELNAEEQAVVFIGTKFEKALKQEPYEPMMFAAPLFESISKAHRNPNTTASKSLMNALFILSQEDLNISASLLEKYHLDAEKIKTIKRVYNLVVNG